MKNWSKTRLGELVDILSGFAFDSKKFGESGEIPIVRIRDIIPGSSSTFYCGEYDQKFVIQDGDLLIGMDGEFNRAKWRGGNALLNQRVCRIASSCRDLDDTYLFYFLPLALKAIENVTPYVTVKHLSVKQIRDIEIPLPPLEEQKRIAEILDQADELRRKRKEAIAQLDTLTQSIFLEMFGDPVVNPKGWDIGRLEDIADFQTGYPFKSSEYTTNGETVKLCRGANILPNHLDWTDLALWPKNRTNTLREFALEAGDVVIAMDRPWISSGFKIAQIEQTDLPALLVQRVARLRGKNSYSNSFIFQILKLPIFAHHCKPTETTVPHKYPGKINCT